MLYLLSMKNWFKSFFSGAAIGVASSIPGVSGGTIAVILKIYDTIVGAVGGLLKNFKKNVLILLPIFLGVIVAFMPCLLLMDIALNGFIFALVCLFAGFIIGSFPSITDNVKGQKVTNKDIIAAVICFVVTISLGIISVIIKSNNTIDDWFQNPNVWLFLTLIPVGAIGASALVIPGISGGTLLLILGYYKPIIQYCSEWLKEMLSGNFDHTGALFGIAGCFLVGAILGFFFISKFMHFCLSKYRKITFYSIIGFILGSIITLFVNNTLFDYFRVWAEGSYIAIPMFAEIIIGAVLLIAAAIGAYMLVRYERKLKQAEANQITQSKAE